MPFRNRAGFIEDNGCDATGQLEDWGAFYEDAHARAASRANEDGCRRREAQRAGTRNDKDGGGVQDCRLQARRFGTEQHPQ